MNLLKIIQWNSTGFIDQDTYFILDFQTISFYLTIGKKKLNFSFFFLNCNICTNE